MKPPFPKSRLSEIGEETVQTVSARDLHAFLGAGKVFAAWIKERIEQYDFIESHDFVVFPILEITPEVATLPKEYAITLDMAKELAMVERNEKGKQARQYFFECEREAKQARNAQFLIPKTLPEALRLAADLAEQKAKGAAELAIAAPKADALDRLSESDGSQCIADVAKALDYPPKKFFALLNFRRWIYRRPGGKNWLGYQDKIVAGLVEHKITTVIKGDGSEKRLLSRH